jgi:hypothetical protein
MAIERNVQLHAEIGMVLIIRSNLAKLTNPEFIKVHIIKISALRDVVGMIYKNVISDTEEFLLGDDVIQVQLIPVTTRKTEYAKLAPLCSF